MFEKVSQAFMRVDNPAQRLMVVTPVLPAGTAPATSIRLQRGFVDRLLTSIPHRKRLLWYYTPIALRFSSHVERDLCIYDCMDELSAFKGAPLELADLERVLFGAADIVFTGGQSLYEAKRALHPSVHLFPSSIDATHFNQARNGGIDPLDQADIPHPRIGFFGVIDERMDLELVAQTAAAMPYAHFVMLGPVAKIDPASLPCADNLHWLGNKFYKDLPSYLAHWQAGWMPFVLNSSTRYISPTKTPEFLAAGLPVVSTAVLDVVRSYGATGLVEIADANDMPAKLRLLLERPRGKWLKEVDAHLANMSWDRTWAEMATLIARAKELRKAVAVSEARSCSTG
ncbi:glycosyltransferase [Pseudaminobacter sp. NGMCC 1.201702]|uniref:glycosyltransferase n=1 Tax=Pseudaminobacter sp. NGMCC 1.201702 TaxID=3391825 RepID=UPI0039EEF439